MGNRYNLRSRRKKSAKHGRVTKPNVKNGRKALNENKTEKARRRKKGKVETVRKSNKSKSNVKKNLHIRTTKLSCDDSSEVQYELSSANPRRKYHLRARNAVNYKELSSVRSAIDCVCCSGTSQQLRSECALHGHTAMPLPINLRYLHDRRKVPKKTDPRASKNSPEMSPEDECESIDTEEFLGHYFAETTGAEACINSRIMGGDDYVESEYESVDSEEFLEEYFAYNPTCLLKMS